ncbi:hypothetical protein DV735_g237, partial [Chaetothyriales sp. CBS 134920]
MSPSLGPTVMAEKSPEHSTAAASTTPPTRSGRLPGTPKRRFGGIVQLDPVVSRRTSADKMTGSAPISPPRRRSSLAFSKVFTCSSPTKDDSSELDSPRNTISLPLGSPPSSGRKGLPASVHRHSITPGHVARLQQKLLQSARAALRVDMAFAASPTGSIGARLPPDALTRTSPKVRQSSARAAVTPSRIGWRFSVAPNAIAGLDQDVREPVEGYLPTMPNNLPLVALDENELVGNEPVSSGFTSPIVGPVADPDALDTLPALPSSPPVAQSVERDRAGLFGTSHPNTELEEPMTGLKVSPDDENSESGGELEQSPTVAHVERMSGNAIEPVSPASPGKNTPIVLSETAEAAAESARAKRGLLRNLFARRESRNSTTPREQAHDSSESSKSSERSCPDPGLHRLVAGGGCPDPSVHLRYPSPLALQHGLPVTPQAMMGWPPYTPGMMQGGWYPPPPIPFHRATATGSPMPFARARPRHRLRRAGIGAASSAGINRYYGGDIWPDGRVPSHRGPARARSRMRMHDNVQFRSSPPRPVQRMQSPYKRRRPREFEDESLVMTGDGDDLQARLGKDEGLMEIDDETRAAVRMSVWGSDVPEPLQNGVSGLRELSPNVTMWRKGMRQPSKKRRPSYWDGDLKQVRESPAGGRADEAMGNASEGVVQHGGPERRVCTSPAKAEIENVAEQAGLIEMDIDHSS